MQRYIFYKSYHGCERPAMPHASVFTMKFLEKTAWPNVAYLLLWPLRIRRSGHCEQAESGRKARRAIPSASIYFRRAVRDLAVQALGKPHQLQKTPTDSRRNHHRAPRGLSARSHCSRSLRPEASCAVSARRRRQRWRSARLPGLEPKLSVPASRVTGISVSWLSAAPGVLARILRNASSSPNSLVAGLSGP